MRRVTPKTAESDLQRESDQLCQVLLETAQTHKYKYCQSNFFYLENCTNSQTQILSELVCQNLFGKLHKGKFTLKSNFLLKSKPPQLHHSNGL